MFSTIADPRIRLRQLLSFAITFSHDSLPSVFVSLFGEREDADARAALDRVNRARLTLIAAAYRECGLSPDDAEVRARFAYSSYVGLLHLASCEPGSRLDGEDLERTIATALDLLVPTP